MRCRYAIIVGVVLLLVFTPTLSLHTTQADIDTNRPLIADDGAPPLISLLSPTNKSIVKPFSLIDIDVTDNVAVSHVLYHWDLIANETFEAPYDLFARTSEVGHYLYVYANDTSDTWSKAVFYFISDGTQPEITITTPANDSIQLSGVDINATITDIHLTDVFYHWDQEEILNIWPEPYSTQLISGDRPHTLHVSANDSAGNWIEANFVFVVDDNAPIITLKDLTNNTARQSNSLIDIDILDSSIHTVLFNWESDILNQTWIEPYQTYMPAGESIHTLRVFANDSFDRWQSSRFSFIGDDTIPQIILDSPDNETVMKSGFDIEISTIDTHLQTVWHNWDRGLNQTGPISAPSGDGEHILRVYANDTAGNTADSIYIFSVDDTPPAVYGPDDFAIHANFILHIEWIVGDDNPGTYLILANGTEVDSGVWISDVDYSVLYNQTVPTLVNYTLVVVDALGNVAVNTVMVTILEPLPPIDFEPNLLFTFMAVVVGSGSVIALLIIFIVKKKRS